MEQGILVLLMGLLAVVGQVYFAYEDKFLTVAQMQARGFGFVKGLPLVAHAGIWGDLIILTPLLAVIVGLYADHWSMSNIVTTAVIGVIVTIGMGFVWVKAAEHGLPEAHTHDGRITVAGFIHAVYMAAAIAVIGLFFFYSDISQKAATVVAVILAVHVIYGTHIVLGLIAPSWYPDRPHKQVLTWVIVFVCWGALVWRCATI